MHPSKQLFQLQTLDLERDGKHRRLKSVIASLNEPEALRNAAATLAAVQEKVAHARTKRRDLELEIQTLEAKIASVEERLYSGRVKNPKELSDLQNDSTSLRRHHGTLDDQLLEAMIGLEDAERAEKQAHDQLASLQAEWQVNQRALMEERSKLEAEIAALAEQRHQQIAKIAPDHLARYQQRRHEHAGLAVARVEDGSCGACGVEISDRLLAQVGLSDALSYCGNCDRILLVE
jgi:predicted  nucleic acid-binding Zn-ribbon protein